MMGSYNLSALNPSQGGSLPARELAVPSITQKMSVTLAELQMALSELEKRLSPVLQQTGPSAVSESNEKLRVECGLVEELRRAHQVIHGLLQHVASLQARLEI